MASHCRTWVQSQVNSCEIHGGWNGTETDFFPSVFGFSSLINTPPLLHTHVSLPLELCNSPQKAAHYHIVGFYAGGFNTDLAFGNWVCLLRELVSMKMRRWRYDVHKKFHDDESTGKILVELNQGTDILTMSKFF